MALMGHNRPAAPRAVYDSLESVVVVRTDFASLS